jgi:AraC-like DNA-binding protein
MVDLSWVAGPLLYFYVRAQAEPGFRFVWRDGWHFVPVFLQLGFSVFVRLQNLYWDGTRESLSWLGYWGYVVWMNHATIHLVAAAMIVVYALAASRLLNRQDEQVVWDPARLSWLKRIIRVFLVFFAVVLVLLLADLIIYRWIMGNNYFYFIRFYYHPFFAGLSILTYWLGLAGFMRRHQPAATVPVKVDPDKQRHLSAIADELDRLMVEQQIYRQPGLSLQQLADAMDLKAYLITNALNTIKLTSFVDYINQLRIDDIKQQLQTPDGANNSLLSLALDGGFNSKSSFIRAIKKQTGLTPRQWREQLLNNHTQ